MKHSLFALALIAAAPFAASAADGVSYNYVQGGYTATNGDADAKGYSIDGSVAVHPNLHIFGGYTAQNVDHSSIDVDEWRIGLGYNRELSKNVDLVSRIAYDRLKADAGNGLRASVNGYNAEVGVRGAVTPHFEAYAMAGYEDHKQIDGNAYGRLGAQVKFNQNWSVDGNVKFANGDTQWTVGPRFTW